MTDPPGNPRVLWISFLAFSLGFAVWGMFSALAPFLIKWYNFSTTQVLVLAAMEPFFAAAVSIPLGILTDKFGGRTVFTLLLLTLTVPLFCRILRPRLLRLSASGVAVRTRRRELRGRQRSCRILVPQI